MGQLRGLGQTIEGMMGAARAGTGEWVCLHGAQALLGAHTTPPVTILAVSQDGEYVLTFPASLAAMVAMRSDLAETRSLAGLGVWPSEEYAFAMKGRDSLCPPTSSVVNTVCGSVLQP